MSSLLPEAKMSAGLPDQDRAACARERHMHRISAILAGDDDNPFSFLGLHKDEESGNQVVRAFLPGAARVVVLHRETGQKLAELLRTHDAGFFTGSITSGSDRPPYRLRVSYGATEIELDDPYSFGPVLGELDLYLHAEGSYLRAFEKMGAHPIVMDGISGTSFVVWAPNARRVSVVGDFNDWDGRRHSMRLHPGAGIWEIFLPCVAPGARYKYEIKTRDWNKPGNIKDYLKRINSIRRANPALLQTVDLRFVAVDDGQVIGFVKESPARDNAVAVAVALTGGPPRTFWFHFGNLEIGPEGERRPVRAVDNLATGERLTLEWGGLRLTIDPERDPALLFRCHA